MRKLCVVCLFLCSVSILFAQTTLSDSRRKDNTIEISGTVNYSYERESFVTIFSAWQDIKIHSLTLLQLVSTKDVDTITYPAGEVYEVERDRYSTGYVFVKKIKTSNGIRIYNIQTDVIIDKEKITVNYKIISNKDMDYGLPQQDLEAMQERYQKNISSLNDSFVAYFMGMKRLAREYHGIIIEDSE